MTVDSKIGLFFPGGPVVRATLALGLTLGTAATAACGESSGSEPTPTAYPTISIPEATSSMGPAKPKPTTNPSSLPASRPTVAPESTATATAAPATPESSVDSLSTVAQIEELAPTIQDHQALSLPIRLFYNHLIEKEISNGYYSSYLSFEMYSEKDKDGNPIPDPMTALFNYAPNTPETEAKPTNTCEEIRLQLAVGKALLTGMTADPTSSYGFGPELPLDTNKANRYLAGMVLKAGAQDKSGFTKAFTPKEGIKAYPNVRLAEDVCASQSPQEPLTRTVVDEDGNETTQQYKNITIRIPAGTEYDYTVVFAAEEIRGKTINKWLVDSYKPR